MSAHVLTHGVISDPLPPTAHLTHDRKGREGKGIGIGDVVPIHRHLGDSSLCGVCCCPIGAECPVSNVALARPASATMDDRFAAIGGGRR